MPRIRFAGTLRVWTVLAAATALASCQGLKSDDALVGTTTPASQDAGDSGGPDVAEEQGAADAGGPDVLADRSADSSVESDDADAGSCATLGEAVCSGTSVEMCASVNGVRAWTKLGDCPSESMCCGGICVANDVSNCFACGARCAGDSPVCSPAARHCVCTSGSCDGGTCDEDGGVCAGPVLPDADLYVDAAVPVGGDGSRAHPFRTITAALSALAVTLDGGAADAAIPKARIYAAAGVYDEALGEVFPLDLKGLSLQGAGRDQTIIVGTGAYSVAWNAGAAPSATHVAVLAGDDTRPTRLSDLSLRPVSNALLLDYNGVVCARGDLQSDGSDKGVTVLDSVTLGPGFHQAISAISSDTPTLSGCHLRLTRSEVRDSYAGVLARGCYGSPLPSKVVIEIGGADAATGNSLTGMRTAANDGYGVLVQGCVASASLRNNVLTDNASAVAVDAKGNGTTATYMVLASNLVQRSSNTGISLTGGPVTVYAFDDNVVTQTSKSLVGDVTHVASAVYAESYNGFLARFVRARRNRITDNDLGLFIVSPEGTPFTVANLPPDFGTDADPGQNVFRCNSSPTYGYDVLLWFPTSVTIPFVGNVWDHSPPTVIVGAGQNGADLQLVGLGGSDIDFSQSTTLADPCPTGRISGP